MGRRWGGGEGLDRGGGDGDDAWAVDGWGAIFFFLR